MLASVAAFVVQLDGSALNVALPTLGQEFGVPLALLQWIVDAYTLTYACLLLSAGAASDRFGASRVFAWGLGLFAFASVVCALSPRAELLIAGRVLQGAAGSILIPSSLALIHHVHGDDEGARIKAIGWWTAGGGVAITAGPVVGGLCVGYLGWRSIFLINIPICMAGMAFASRLPAGRLTQNVPLLRDRLGQILAAVSMLGLVGGIIEGGSRGFGSSIALTGLAVSVSAGALFLRREARLPFPVLPLSLFQARSACVATAAGFVLSL
jgi:DHA2 family methylenomycin A resistance protein-like MFS transporter